MSETNLVPWVVFLPLIGLVLNLLVGKRLGQKGAGIAASLAAGLSFVVSILLALGLARDPKVLVTPPLAEWITVGSFQANWAFQVDTLSVTMMLVVSGVGTLIHIYAIGYMYRDVRFNDDPGRYRRFFVYFNLFIVAMMVLVSASNYLMLFVGWEGVGLCSYLLIGFWFERNAPGFPDAENLGNARAAKKAFVVNRIGDFGLLIALFLVFWYFGSLNFGEVFAKVSTVAPGVILAITLFMLLGVTGKSAQLPLYIWLPDAMAGPTPVSALIHAATMVTAGVYLVARSSPLYLAAPVAQAVVTWVGALTALFAATIAVGQFDIKKVLAYSTISQLGYMVAAVGMGAFAAGMFHLVTHAFFKALLFLAAGSVILGLEHAHQVGHDPAIHDAEGEDVPQPVFDPQDMRNMGGLQERMPLTFWVYLIGALTLAGVAPLAGFFSKDEILAAASKTSIWVFLILAVAAFLTAFYISRQIFMVFFGKPRSTVAAQAQESTAIITIPLVILAVLSGVGGAINLPGITTLEGWLEHSLEKNLAVPFTWPVALLSLVLVLVAIIMAWWFYGLRRAHANDPDPLVRYMNGLFSALQHKWWVDELYHTIFVAPYQNLSEFLASRFDLGIIDGIVNGLGDMVRSQASQLRKVQTGYARLYALSILLGVVLILAYLAYLAR